MPRLAMIDREAVVLQDDGIRVSIDRTARYADARRLMGRTRVHVAEDRGVPVAVDPVAIVDAHRFEGSS